MKDRSDDPSHHERTLLPRSYISLPAGDTNRQELEHPGERRATTPRQHRHDVHLHVSDRTQPAARTAPTGQGRRGVISADTPLDCALTDLMLPFFDDSHFHLRNADGRLRVSRRRGERYHNDCLVHRRGGGSVMVCGGISDHHRGRMNARERNVLFNDALNTFYLRLYGVRHMVKDHSDSDKARVLLYAPSHRQDSTYHGLCYTSRGALAGTRNSSMSPLHEGSIRMNAI